MKLNAICLKSIGGSSMATLSHASKGTRGRSLRRTLDAYPNVLYAEHCAILCLGKYVGARLSKRILSYVTATRCRGGLHWLHASLKSS